MRGIGVAFGDRRSKRRQTRSRPHSAGNDRRVLSAGPHYDQLARRSRRVWPMHGIG